MSITSANNRRSRIGNLYRSLGAGAFADASFAASLGEPSLMYVGFGINWIAPRLPALSETRGTPGSFIAPC